MWEQSKTVFVTLNVPGGSNNDIDPWYTKTHSSPWNPNQQIEMDQRTGADVRWLKRRLRAGGDRQRAQRCHCRPGRHVGHGGRSVAPDEL